MTNNRPALAFLWMLVVNQAAFATTSGVLSSRSDLSDLLGNAAVTEGFELFSLPPESFREFAGSLDASTTLLGQGPGLVVPGVRFSVYPIGQLQWYGTTLFGGDSQRLSFSLTIQYRIEFSPPVSAFGIDLGALPGHNNKSQFSVYNRQQMLVGMFDSADIDDPIDTTFAGFAFLPGISKVEFSAFAGGPIIDNVTFGRVPEPTSAALLLACAMFARRIRHRGVGETIAAPRSCISPA